MEKECCGINTFHVGQAKAWCYAQGECCMFIWYKLLHHSQERIDLWLNKCQQITRVTQYKLYTYWKHSTQPLLVPTRRLLAQSLLWQRVHPSVCHIGVLYPDGWRDWQTSFSAHSPIILVFDPKRRYSIPRGCKKTWWWGKMWDFELKSLFRNGRNRPMVTMEC